MKQKIFIFILILITLFILEAFSFTGLELIRRKKHFVYLPTTENIFSDLQKQRIQKLLNHTEQYITYHPVLGWTIKPNGADPYHRSNSQGFRADQDVQPYPSDKKIRISAYGDSYMHSDDVQNDATWLKYLSDIDPTLEPLNFGVPGYGTDQSFLRYQETGIKFHPDIVMIGFMSENPRRNVNAFRPFYNRKTQIPLSKPRFILEGTNLTLIDNPLSELKDYQELLDNPNENLLRLSRNDYYYQSNYKRSPFDISQTVRLFKVLKILYIDRSDKIMKRGIYNPDSNAFKITLSILERFYNTVKNDGARPLIVVIPNRYDLKDLIGHPGRRRIYKPYIDMFRKKEWLYVDLTDYFLEDPRNDNVDQLFGSGEHFSAEGNRRVAEYIYQFIKENGLLTKRTN
ncbi:MAG: hypothetical protein AB7S78_09620 [Candidatus Omnitrophota bacterium]